MSLERRSNQDLPAWYTLEIQDKQFRLSLHKQAIVARSDYFRRLTRLYDDMHFAHPFILPSADREWGFGPVIAESQHPELSDWLIYQCNLPAYLKNKEIDWNSIFEVAAPLSMIFRQLSTLQLATDSGFPQMTEIRLDSSRSNENPIFVDVRPALSKWIHNNIGRGQEPVIAKVMQNTYVYMHGSQYVHDYNFNVWFRQPHRIDLQCPGNACSLNPSATYYSDRIGEAFELTPHNVDDPIQQLTLLSGLAKIDKLAHEGFLK